MRRKEGRMNIVNATVCNATSDKMSIWVIWTYTTPLNKFSNIEINFENSWTQVTPFDKFKDIQYTS